MNLRRILLLLLFVSTFTISCKESNQHQKKNTDTLKEAETKKKKQEAVIEKEEPSITKESKNSKYVCFTNDNNKSKRIWVEFAANGKASHVKYEGQNEAISLQYVKEESTEGGAHPTIKNYYQEIYKGEVNGEYILTHSGVWDYVTYIRGKDGKEFNYTIDHNSNPYGKKPCF
ncbi:hypothetical protein [Mesonia aestuariivivens]|uniref:Beta-lactamase-inhibitor-like PepSY-like domain-containing protein n=1 Tax=Mesonia aestuariivivens TaxID=2796128 RepID=A0ABS6W169_9FLAO|nr:hypothetical protein [Mesonia aestuariivivens]MBW2961489.1 hypothetical protein [Mesonia aestuariivivens]